MVFHHPSADRREGSERVGDEKNASDRQYCVSSVHSFIASFPSSLTGAYPLDPGKILPQDKPAQQAY